MIEYLVFAGFLLVLMVSGYILYRKQEISLEIADNKYRLDKKKLYATLKGKKGHIESENEDAEDFEESLPKWLRSIFEGANIDIEAVYEGDPEELSKVKDILDKHLPKSQGSPGAPGAPGEDVLR